MTDRADETLYLSPDVRSAGRGDSLVLLDLRSGRYLALSATAAFIWRGLEAGRTPARIAALVEDRYTIPAQRAAADVEAMVEQLVASGLVLRQAPPATVPAEPGPEPGADPRARELADELSRVPEAARRSAGAADLGRALAVLVLVDLLMRRSGIGRVRRLVASCRPRGTFGLQGPAAAARVWATIHAVDLVSALYFKTIWCLQRSAACAYLLRRQNGAAELVLGVRPAPFYAHAWVEIGGRPVGGGDRDLPGTLTIIDRW